MFGKCSVNVHLVNIEQMLVHGTVERGGVTETGPPHGDGGERGGWLAGAQTVGRGASGSRGLGRRGEGRRGPVAVPGPPPSYYLRGYSRTLTGHSS